MKLIKKLASLVSALAVLLFSQCRQVSEPADDPAASNDKEETDLVPRTTEPEPEPEPRQDSSTNFADLNYEELSKILAKLEEDILKLGQEEELAKVRNLSEKEIEEFRIRADKTISEHKAAKAAMEALRDRD